MSLMISKARENSAGLVKKDTLREPAMAYLADWLSKHLHAVTVEEFAYEY